MSSSFFDRYLPFAIVQRADDFFACSGSISFSISGPEGGDWTLIFGDPDPIRRGLEGEADLKLWFTQGAFEGFVNGSIDTCAAVSSGEVRAEGNLELLEILGAFLLPPQRDLGWDAGDG